MTPQLDTAIVEESSVEALSLNMVFQISLLRTEHYFVSGRNCGDQSMDIYYSELHLETILEHL